MDSKGTRLAFVLGLTLVIIISGVYFYEKTVFPQNSSATSSSMADVNGASSSSYNDSSHVSTPDGITASASSGNGESKQSAYPAGITPVQKVTADMKGQNVTVRGYAVKMTSGKGHHFYTFRDIVEPGSIKVVVFKAEGDNRAMDVSLQNSLNAGSPVTLSGKVDIYNGELEIIASKASE